MSPSSMDTSYVGIIPTYIQKAKSRLERLRNVVFILYSDKICGAYHSGKKGKLDIGKTQLIITAICHLGLHKSVKKYL